MNHDAQNFPTLHYQPGTDAYNAIDMKNFDTSAHFDRIICDVPCSSDAAIRKIPKKWETWDPNDGAAMHPLQLRILLRSLMLLKANSDDSYLTYSTCSLNPIENEAVVHAALKRLNEDSKISGEFELVDCRDRLHPFKTRPGLLRWRVYDSFSRHRRRRYRKAQQKANEEQKEGEGDQEANANEGEGDQVEGEGDEAAGENQQNKTQDAEPVLPFEEVFREYKTTEDIPEERQDRFKHTFFPPEGTDEEIEEKYHLSRCVRVFPNDQDTSAFFIALFKRNPINKNDNKDEEEVKEEKPKQEVVPVQKPLKNLIR